MKVILFTFLLLSSTVDCQQVQDIDEIRHLYVHAQKEKVACQQLYNLTENSNLNANTLAYSYHAVAKMMLAKHDSNPVKKWRYFYKGKNMLENAINKYPNNLELRFLRYCVQLNVPDFLAYNSNLESDKEIITNQIDEQTESLQLFIKPILKTL